VFDAELYLDRYPGVRAAGVSPLLDYLNGGADMGRNPSDYFDSAWYKRTYLAGEAVAANPLEHFLLRGRALNHRPAP
jgi:hypothetical protein